MSSSSIQPFGTTAVTLAASISTLAVARGLRKKTLSRNGAAAAWCVGFGSVGSGLRGFVLLMFYQIASSATKYKKDWKQERDATAAEGSVRGAEQVLCCSAIATLLGVYHALFLGAERSIDFDRHPLASSLGCAILAHHATCLADTLASELGMLSSTSPVLITSLKRVPPGTNGGITPWGTLMSAVGGGLMGLGTAWMDWCSGIHPIQTPKLFLYGTLCGVVGSGIDSVLGATVQATYFDNGRVHHDESSESKQIAGRNVLTNVQVNLISVCVTTVFGGWVLGPWMFR